MYLIKETTDRIEMLLPSPFGPGFSKELVSEATKMELWGSDFNESDYCKFRLFNNDDLIGEQRISGY